MPALKPALDAANNMPTRCTGTQNRGAEPVIHSASLNDSNSPRCSMVEAYGLLPSVHTSPCLPKLFACC
jgi:hypothetical protein